MKTSKITRDTPLETVVEVTHGIHAGCQKFRLREARAHWKNKRNRAEIRRAVEEIAWLAARRVAAGNPNWRAR